ncbi:hypothetical protein AURDEDRAFT_175189 [Auricularia subglabra TFB-10046 SS5]|nr:hypothetical protein AURDEDRAFT_175189 [Auricularia subglabra TFB-10046 SS5]
MSPPSTSTGSPPQACIAIFTSAHGAADASGMPVSRKATPPVTSMPPELPCHAVRFLPYLSAWVVTNVSKSWRATLLADPVLWTHIAVYLTENTHDRWLPTVRALVERSAGRPLTLELYCDEEDVRDRYGALYDALEQVAAFLAGHLRVMKSLSLNIPTCGTSSWYGLLRKCAPLLETFRLHNSTFDDPWLPTRLFGGHAPRLRTVSLEQAYFPLDLSGMSGEALKGVTSLGFHTSSSIEHCDGLERLVRAMPNLGELTCSVLEAYKISLYCPLALDLRLSVEAGVQDLVASFPRARSVVYSFAGGNGRNFLQIVETAIASRSRFTSVDISWTPVRADIFWLHPWPVPRYLSLALDGRPVVVDIPLETLRAAMTPSVVALLAFQAHSLSVVEEMWDLFSAAEMPELRSLAICLHEREDGAVDGAISCGNAVPCLRKLDALHLLRASGANGTADWVIPPAVISSFLRDILADTILPKFILSRITIAEDGNRTLGAATRVVYRAVRGNVTTWSWALSQDKMVLPRL